MAKVSILKAVKDKAIHENYNHIIKKNQTKWAQNLFYHIQNSIDQAQRMADYGGAEADAVKSTNPYEFLS